MGLWTPSSRIYEERLLICTHHEAGHAVLDLLLGFELQEVVAYVTRPWFGAPEMVGWAEGASDDLEPDDDPELWDAHMITCYGGSQAEALLYAEWGERRPFKYAYAHSDGDFELIQTAEQYTSLSPEEAEDTALQLLEEHWDAVTVVAEALQEHGELSGDDVADLIDSKDGE
jgi:hypothetical protein